ncbi:MAG: AgmX/PglI C-terminal domain-containing protein [Myxococcales bacterium]|nr:AgmX/PglI C-terminal domain-containing protein [Myxococcota bacterium]MDW8280954.1 AgmX/PglI C-terminal domain-containing protein [Myxococcales bacterium]
MTVLEIFIFRGDVFVGSRVFTDRSISIGRGSSAMLRLDDREISRLHATILVDGARLVLRDEGSQIGTRLNGALVRERTFREVDTIEIGSFRLKVARRSMASSPVEEDDEPTGVGLRADALRKHLEPTDATPLPAPDPGLGHSSTPLPLAAEQKPATPVAMEAVSHAAEERLEQDWVQQRPWSTPQGTDENSLEARRPPAPAPAVSTGSIPTQRLAVIATPSPAAVHEEPVAAALPLPAAEDPGLQTRTGPATAADASGATTQAPATAGAERTAAEPVAYPAVAGAGDPALTKAAEGTPDERAGEDGDEDEEEDFVPDFSLLEMLGRDPPRARAHQSAMLCLEVVHHRDGRVIDVQQIPRRRSFQVGGRQLVRLDAEGRAQLAVTEQVNGRVVLNNRSIPLEEIRRGARDRKGVALLEMREGDLAEVVVCQPSPASTAIIENHYHIRFVRLPPVHKDRVRPVRGLVHTLGNRYLVGAVALHALMLFMLSMLPSGDAQAITEEPRFAEVSMKAIRLEPPPEEKSPEPPVPRTPQLATAAPAVRVRTRNRMIRPPQHSVLAALDLFKPETSPQSLKDVVSNISAVSIPADARSRFKVGGAIGKLPVGEVRVSTAGLARDATTSGRELLARENVGALKGAGGSGHIRGLVRQAPPAALQSAGSGRLSRAQIQKVINDHVGAVQACYERNLMRDHSLAGKITFDWVISPSGAVSSVRVRASTMPGSAVSSCVLQEIRSWVFPAPEGGSVSVTYPFIFTAQGY